MTSSNFQVRRATVDDLAVLRRLWQEAHCPGTSLEKRLTEFQVAETAEGQVLGALGIQLEGRHGKIHSEAYATAELAEELRPRLWERVQALARNHALSRLWVESGAVAFWLEQNFEIAGSDVLKTLPKAFAAGETRPWLTLQLREETSPTLSIEQEINLFRQSQGEERARLHRQARFLKLLAVVVTTVMMILLGLAIWTVWRGLRPPR